MADQPLQPFSTPFFFTHLPAGMPSAGILLEWFLYIVFAFWAIYTLVAVYHWLKYSHASWVAFPAIAVHALISLSLMSYALSGNALWLSSYIPLP